MVNVKSCVETDRYSDHKQYVLNHRFGGGGGGGIKRSEGVGE